jgi:hypothetical protein
VAITGCRKKRPRNGGCFHWRHQASLSSVCATRYHHLQNSLNFQRLQGRYSLCQVFFVPGWCHRWWTPMLTTNEVTAN